ncbi:hypothetical protein [Alkalibacillus haloalkaliphilus]|uniref:hypothetical protein n=1 Tax=Alkalibacillus haloalkaliphilus TaxID=94136 RepID=UPI0002F5BDE5|nr:hypothetical protein [Alkalibacillus haloalkaliphilus]
MYQSYLYGLIKAPNEQLYRIEKQEVIRGQWKVQLSLIVLTVAVYILMASFGMGTNYLTYYIIEMTEAQFFTAQVWFVMGRVAYAILFALVMLYLISYYFHLLTKIPYKKALLLQQVVLLALIIERLLWVPLFTLYGLDWNGSPLSLGVIASYLTERDWLIAFFGSISVIQVWIVYFQIRYLHSLSTLSRGKVWTIVLSLNIFLWSMVSLMTYLNSTQLEGWLL